MNKSKTQSFVSFWIRLSWWAIIDGDSDVGDNVILVTSRWWLFLDVGERIVMLTTCFVMLVIFSMYQIGHKHLKVVTNTFGLQHRCNRCYKVRNKLKQHRPRSAVGLWVLGQNISVNVNLGRGRARTRTVPGRLNNSTITAHYKWSIIKKDKIGFDYFHHWLRMLLAMGC